MKRSFISFHGGVSYSRTWIKVHVHSCASLETFLRSQRFILGRVQQDIELIQRRDMHKLRLEAAATGLLASLLVFSNAAGAQTTAPATTSTPTTNSSDVNSDRRDLRHDRRDINRDRRDLSKDKTDIRSDR